MALFRINYIHPQTEQPASEEVEFFDVPAGGNLKSPISAREWAEDYAYSLADKGHYKITELNPKET